MALHNANTVIVPCCTVLLFFTKAYNGVIFAPFCPILPLVFRNKKATDDYSIALLKKTSQR